ncbi:MAG: putative small protein [Bacteroidetes bacterium]|nr:putative small protein [Bacteroidota bacterium]
MGKFKIGDQVALKSGSPTMTVSDISMNLNGTQETGFVHVSWYSDGKVNRDEFHEDALEIDE